MDDKRSMEETTLRTEPVFRGKIISLEIDYVRLPDGRTATREIIRHPGAVAVLALHEGKMIVVEQYRKPLGRNQVEIPAGKLEPGEDPARAAVRELEEETGYRCKDVRLLHSFYSSPGFADEIVHLYLAGDLTPGRMNPDEDEFLHAFAVTPEEARRLIGEQRISDAKTIVAYYIWLQMLTEGGFAS